MRVSFRQGYDHLCAKIRGLRAKVMYLRAYSIWPMKNPFNSTANGITEFKDFRKSLKTLPSFFLSTTRVFYVPVINQHRKSICMRTFLISDSNGRIFRFCSQAAVLCDVQVHSRSNFWPESSRPKYFPLIITKFSFSWVCLNSINKKEEQYYPNHATVKNKSKPLLRFSNSDPLSYERIKH